MVSMLLAYAAPLIAISPRFAVGFTLISGLGTLACTKSARIHCKIDLIGVSTKPIFIGAVKRKAGLPEPKSTETCSTKNYNVCYANQPPFIC